MGTFPFLCAKQQVLMSWKKSLPFFIWQSLRYANSVAHFNKIWSYKSRWSQSLGSGRNSVADELPWLNFAAIDFLQSQALPKSNVFEFGGGGSTLFFCKNDAYVSTVEDHAEWFKILTETVAQKGYPDWKGFFVSPEPYSGDKQRSPENPEDFMSGSPGLGNLSFEKYARCINSFPPEHFDLILVDGRARPSCIQQSIPHLKSNGLLVIDNTERPYYLRHFQSVIAASFKVELDVYAPVGYTPDFTKTTILRKH